MAAFTNRIPVYGVQPGQGLPSFSRGSENRVRRARFSEPRLNEMPLWRQVSTPESQAMSNPSPHPSEAQLIAFNQGRLEEAELRATSAHLDECPDCISS